VRIQTADPMLAMQSREQFLRISVTQLDCRLHVRGTRLPIPNGQVDERQIVQDDPAQLSVPDRCQCTIEIVAGCAVATESITNHAPVECGVREVLVEIQGPVIIRRGEVEPAEGLIGQPSVVVALCCFRRKRNGDSEGVDRLLETVETVSA